MISKYLETDVFTLSSKLSVIYVQRDELNQEKGLTFGLLTPYRLGFIKRKNLLKRQKIITSPQSVILRTTDVAVMYP
jgi:hypothetical protein